MDLDRESRAALEFDALLDAVAGHAVTPLGARCVRGLVPLGDRDRLGEELGRVDEACRHLDSRGRLVSGNVPDPTATLGSLGVEGLRLEPRELRDLASAIAVAVEVGLSLRRVPEEALPRLRELGQGIPDLGETIRPVLQHVDPEGAIADEASPELRAIRHEIRRVSARLRRVLESHLRAPEAEAVIRDEFVTERNGRFVIPVRTDAPRRVRGIVHASSSSGATVFVEPMETVGLNNDLVELREQEQAEQDRLLLDWSARLGHRKDEVRRSLEAIAVVDALQARALFARDLGGVVPRIGEGRALCLREVRHPLLELRLRADGEACVPLDIELGPDDRVLVLSGPNTGGKTVALKTLGLAVLMAQSAIPLAAGQAQLPIFRQLRADIGDHQSIQADLSTFSAHLRAAVRFLEEIREPAIMLFDEIGTGTEPAEGVALARALLERLNRDGITTAATTHHGALKAWAFTTTGALSAAMDFDTEHLRPTFRVVPGAAGASAGLDIAAKLGLDAELVERARSYIGGDEEQTQAYLVRLRELTRELEQRSRELEEQRSALIEEGRRQRETARKQQAVRARDAEQALARALSEFGKRAERELRSIRDEAARVRLERRRSRAEQRLQLDSAARARRIEATPQAPVTRLAERPSPGMRVHVRSLGRDGEVSRVLGERVEVLLGSVSFNVEVSDLFQPTGPGPERSATTETRSPAVVPSVEGGSASELILVGKTVDEALRLLDKWLDAAALAGRDEVRIVHGHGTGRLRAAVRAFLDEHPQVMRHRPGGRGEGGDGATVATLG